jgi:rhamnosyltransferase
VINKTLISIIIPVKNGEKTIIKCLDAIKSQTLFNHTEVIIIDSGSTDSTLEILKKYSFIRLYQIPPDEFNHGDTRNYGVSLAKGKFVVMTVQDAWASSNNWLEIMSNHFYDEKVSAVVGQQVVPHDRDKNPQQWFRPVSKPRIIEMYFANPQDFLKLSGKEQDENCFYDDVNTMYRKSILLEFPFDAIEFGEDMMVIKKFLSSRKKVIYDANSSVYHYHFLEKQYVYKVTFTLIYFKYLIFGYIVEFDYSIKDFLLIIYRNFKYKAHFKWIFHNFAIHIWQRKAYKDFIKYNKKGNFELDLFYRKINPKVVQSKNS